MIFGIGTDIIEINRIENAISKESFLLKYFTEKEIDYFKSKHFKPETIAGNFCAKEAVVKCFGTGFGNITAKDIEILRTEKGAPYVIFYNKALDFISENNIINTKVTISHSKEYATAYAIMEV